MWWPGCRMILKSIGSTLAKVKTSLNVQATANLFFKWVIFHWNSRNLKKVMKKYIIKYSRS